MSDQTQDVGTEAGRALDELVAERVMGFEWRDVRLKGETNTVRVLLHPNVVDIDGMYDRASLRHPRHAEYSTDVAAAWQVVERMRDHPEARFRNLSLTAYCYNRTYATFDCEAFADYDPTSWAEANGEHATPLAICRAALLAASEHPFPTTGPRAPGE